MGAVAYKKTIYGAPESVETLTDTEISSLADGDIFEYDDTSGKWKNSKALDNKVDKISGKGLSTNDYTTAEKEKLAGIATGAEVNVQPDWNQTDSSADDYIKNKPSEFNDTRGSQTATGSIVTVTDAAPIYAEQVDVAVVATQTGSGTPSPSNVRPIQGYDIVSVGRAKSYQRCVANNFTSTTENGLTMSYLGNGKYHVKGTMTSQTNTSLVADINEIVCYDGTDSYLAFHNTYGNTSVLVYFNNGNTQVSSWSLSPVDRYSAYTGMRGQTINKFRVYFPSSFAGTTFDFTLQPELISNDTLNKVNVQLGNKNLIPMTVEGIKAANSSASYSWSGNVCTVNGGKFTVITDGNGLVTDIDIDGTFTYNTSFYIKNFSLDSNSYIFTSGRAVVANTNVVITTGSGAEGIGTTNTYRTINNSISGNCYLYVTANNAISHVKYQPMLRYANIVDATFSPYNPSLGGMVYGGQLTLKDDGSAVFVGDKVTETYNGSESEGWIAIASGASLYYRKPLVLPANVTRTDVMICSHYERKAITSSNTYTNVFNVLNAESGTIPAVAIRPDISIYTNTTLFKNYLRAQAQAGTPVQVSYYLLNSFTIPLSAEQLKLLQGTNNVWSNAGDVTLKYQPDNVIAEPKADVQRLRDDVDDRLVGNACRNLINKENVINGYINSSVSSGYNGEILASSSGSKTVYCLLEAGTYTVQKMASTRFRYALYDDKPTIGSRSRGDGYNDVNGTTTTFTLVAQRWVAFFIVNGSDATDAANTDAILGSIQVERGSFPSPYEEYYPSNRELAEQIAALDGDYLPLSGGTLTGKLTGTSIETSSDVQVGGSLFIENNYVGIGRDSTGGKSGTFTSTLDFYWAGNSYSGRTRLMNQSGGNPNITLPSSTGTLALTDSSSRKVKKNISDMTEDEAKKLFKLRPVNYDYIDDSKGIDCYGFIAEEVEEIGITDPIIDTTFPVTDDETINVPGLDYAKFVPYLVKVVQMQQKQIDMLKSKML